MLKGEGLAMPELAPEAAQPNKVYLRTPDLKYLAFNAANGQQVRGRGVGCERARSGV
jgi:hypothetical protein